MQLLQSSLHRFLLFQMPVSIREPQIHWLHRASAQKDNMTVLPAVRFIFKLRLHSVPVKTDQSAIGLAADPFQRICDDTVTAGVGSKHILSFQCSAEVFP